jgi:hypothetical protein
MRLLLQLARLVQQLLLPVLAVARARARKERASPAK